MAYKFDMFLFFQGQIFENPDGCRVPEALGILFKKTLSFFLTLQGIFINLSNLHMVPPPYLFLLIVITPGV